MCMDWRIIPILLLLRSDWETLWRPCSRHSETTFRSRRLSYRVLYLSPIRRPISGFASSPDIIVLKSCRFSPEIPQFILSYILYRLLATETSNEGRGAGGGQTVIVLVGW